jgi:sporulation protein YlmC with PRC-barrel domain
MAWTLADAKALKGLTVVDPDGEHVGKIVDVYFDRRTGEIEWAAVRTGLFGSKVSFVPIADAHPNPSGDIVVHVPKEKVKHAPRIEPGSVLTPEEERRLWEYYGLPDYDEWSREDRTQALGLPAETPPMTAAADGSAAVVAIRLRRLVVIEAGRPANVPR